MGLRIRLSRQTLAVLDALLGRAGQWQHGYSLSQSTGIPSGTLYPILMRLEKLHWLETRWEEVKTPGRPPRSEEHTSELQSRLHLVCRLLLEKKKKKENDT